jgi:hypothetical protein
MKKIFGMLVLASAALTANVAHSHGAATANHGGIIQTVGETWIELVVKGDKLEVYFEDDGDDMPTAAMSGKLTIAKGAAKTEVTLKPAGGNKMEATGKGVVKGSKVTVLAVLADKKTHVPATFEIK